MCCHASHTWLDAVDAGTAFGQMAFHHVGQVTPSGITVTSPKSLTPTSPSHTLQMRLQVGWGWGVHQDYILSQVQPQNFSPWLGNLLPTSSWPEEVEQWAGAGFGGQLACLSLWGTPQLGDSGLEVTSLDLTFPLCKMCTTVPPTS